MQSFNLYSIRRLDVFILGWASFGNDLRDSSNGISPPSTTYQAGWSSNWVQSDILKTALGRGLSVFVLEPPKNSSLCQPQKGYPQKKTDLECINITIYLYLFMYIGIYIYIHSMYIYIYTKGSREIKYVETPFREATIASLPFKGHSLQKSRNPRTPAESL